MIVRKAVPADRPAIVACVEASLNATYGGLWTSEPLKADDDDWSDALVACTGDAIVGVGLSQDDVVSDLWVHPAAQGFGAGTTLLAALEQEIAARGFATARLRCLEPNLKSRAFYVARGWVQARVYPHETIPVRTVDYEKVVGGVG